MQYASIVGGLFQSKPTYFQFKYSFFNQIRPNFQWSGFVVESLHTQFSSIQWVMTAPTIIHENLVETSSLLVALDKWFVSFFSNTKAIYIYIYI